MIVLKPTEGETGNKWKKKRKSSELMLKEIRESLDEDARRFITVWQTCLLRKTGRKKTRISPEDSKYQINNQEELGSRHRTRPHIWTKCINEL